jgi:DNA-binding beta-propeller fold protein YncE
MTPVNVAIRRALEWAVMFACLALGSDLATAATASFNVYTLTLGDSTSSTVNGVFFDGQYIWSAVQNPDSGGVLVKLSTSGQTLATVGVGQTPDKIAFDGTNIWVTDYTSSDLRVVAENGNVVATIPLAPTANPEGIIFDGKYIWVANNGPFQNSVSKFDASTRTLIGTYPVGLSPDAVGFDGTWIWVANTYSNAVWKLYRATGAPLLGPLGSRNTGLFPTALVFDGTNMWVANGTGVNIGAETSRGISSVWKIRASDFTVLGTYTVGHVARDMVYDGTSIWVCNMNDNTVSRLRAADVALLGTFQTGTAPRAITYDGVKIWVANAGANTLTVIAPQTPQGISGAITGVTPVVVTQRVVGTAPGVGPARNALLDN